MQLAEGKTDLDAIPKAGAGRLTVKASAKKAEDAPATIS